MNRVGRWRPGEWGVGREILGYARREYLDHARWVVSVPRVGGGRIVYGAGRVGAVFALIVLFLSMPSTALAAETLIDFEDLPAGTPVSTQYESRGVVFGTKPDGSASGSLSIASAAGRAQSGLQVGSIGDGTPEFPASNVWGRLLSPTDFLQVYVGHATANPPGIPRTFVLDGYDTGGSLVASASATIDSSAPVTTPLALTAPSTAELIAFFNVHDLQQRTNTGAIDDLRFQIPDQAIPDFGLARMGDNIPVTLSAGSTVRVPLVVRRFNGSTGAIALSGEGLPTGVSASLEPQITEGGDGAQVMLTLMAADDAPSTSTDIYIRGGPMTTDVGLAPHLLGIPLKVGGVVGGFDLRLKGIEVSQGIQREGILVPNALAGPSGRYAGVSLAEGGRTVVRVYADALGAGAGGVPNVGMALYGSRADGSPLPGGPLFPLAVSPPLGGTASLRVEQSERVNAARAFTFVLPPVWTHGIISLDARVLAPPAPVFQGESTFVECSTRSCRLDNNYRLEGIEFEATRPFIVDVVEMRPPEPGRPCGTVKVPIASATGPPLGSLDEAFSQFRAITPAGEGEVIVRGPRATIFDHQCSLNAEVYRWYQDSVAAPNGLPSSDVAIGLKAAPGGGQTGPRPTAIASSTRPLTALGHELFHIFGAQHASPACNAASGGGVEPWPPDGQGWLQGIGLDRRFGSGSGAPFRIVAADVPNAGDKVYDLMSYCAGEGNAWVSPRNWERAFAYLHAPTASTASTVVASIARGTASGAVGGRLRVLAEVGLAGVRIAQIERTRGRTPAGEPSPYRLVARDEGGRVLAQGAMKTTPVSGHGDPEVSAVLEGELPSRGAARLEILSADALVASATRSAHAPRVRLLAPRGGRRKRLAGRGRIPVRWRAADADGDALGVRIDYSRDGGRHWSEVAADANTGSARVPASFLARARRARLRVVVSDGFNEAVATSRSLRAPGHRPRVRITSVRRGTAVSAEGTLYLAGSAFDDRFAVLTGRRLRWYVGRRLLGRGAAVARTGALRPGSRRIRLVATDRARRRGVNSISVRVLPTVPRFLAVKAPRRLGPRARRLVLAVRTSYPTTLRALGRRFAVSRRTIRIRLKVRPGKRPLTIRLRLGSGRNASTKMIRIARR